MEQCIYNSLPSLAKDLEFRVEKIRPEDLTQSIAAGSILKLYVHRHTCEILVYLYKSADYTALGTLTEEERRILDGWLETVKSKKN